VVLCQSVVLGLLGYVPGAAAALALSRVAGDATGLPMHASPSVLLLVLGLTVAMCGLSGAVAMRRVHAADPAEIF